VSDLARPRRDRGFTLVEVMVATSLLGLVLLLVYGAVGSGVQQAVDVEARIQTQSAVRVAADAFVRDLRQAYTGDAALPRVEAIGPTQITFYSPDRATPFHIRRISYRLSGTALQRSVTTSTDTNGFPWVFGTAGPYVTVLDNVRNTTVFTFRDADGAVTSDAESVALVQLDVTVDRDPSRPPGALVYSTTAELRGV
jgi:prepilin-type N-terminal cleavage/methylation domain-containing protein